MDIAIQWDCYNEDVSSLINSMQLPFVLLGLADSC